jgi:hypothetical protein
MAATAPTVPLYPAQIAAIASYLLANPELAHSYGLAPAESGEPLRNNPETYTYHLGDSPTPGRGYDDRLTVRLGLSRSKLMEELTLWKEFAGRRGGLRHTMGGSKYWVSELACRQYLGDALTTQAA